MIATAVITKSAAAAAHYAATSSPTPLIHEVNQKSVVSTRNFRPRALSQQLQMETHKLAPIIISSPSAILVA